MQSSSLEYAQQNILNVFQPSSCVSTVSDTLTTFSSTPITTLGVVESLTTSSSVVTSISGEVISPVTTTTGMYTHMYISIKLLMNFPTDLKFFYN